MARAGYRQRAAQTWNGVPGTGQQLWAGSVQPTSSEQASTPRQSAAAVHELPSRRQQTVSAAVQSSGPSQANWVPFAVSHSAAVMHVSAPPWPPVRQQIWSPLQVSPLHSTPAPPLVVASVAGAPSVVGAVPSVVAPSVVGAVPSVVASVPPPGVPPSSPQAVSASAVSRLRIRLETVDFMRRVVPATAAPGRRKIAARWNHVAAIQRPQRTASPDVLTTAPG